MTSNIFKNGNISIANSDCFKYIKALENNSINLIIIDPPYYKEIQADWDNQWKTLNDYLSWLDLFFIECFRVLHPQGSIYCFCSDKYTAEIESLIKKRFNFLNHIVWKKTSGRFKAHNKERLRKYATASERILFAEHKNTSGICKGNLGFNHHIDKLKANTFKPIIDYFINAKKELGITSNDIYKATKTHMYKHWFSYSQWELPSYERFIQIYTYFDSVAKKKGLNNPFDENFKTVKSHYDTLKAKYNHLKLQYNEARRYFHVSKEVPYTDVWEYKPVQYYQGKHPCEKPKAMIEHIINASSRKGDVVADFFLGSGVTAITSKELDRKFFGCEIDNTYYNEIIDRLTK